MELIKALSSTKKGRIILFIAAIFLILLIGFVIYVYVNQKNIAEEVTETIDPSGLTLYTSNAEEETAAKNEFMFLGFSVFYDYGFSSKQQQIIYDTISDFFKTNYPNVYKVSYLKDSFKYDSAEDIDKSSFVIVSDTDGEFLVHLDTHWSYDTIDVSITKN